MGPETLGGEPRSLSEPHEACRRKTVQWSRPAVEEVCGGRNRAFVPRVGAGAPVAVHEAERLGCTYARMYNHAVHSSGVRFPAARDQFSISSPVSRRQTRHVRHASGRSYCRVSVGSACSPVPDTGLSELTYNLKSHVA